MGRRGLVGLVAVAVLVLAGLGGWLFYSGGDPAAEAPGDSSDGDGADDAEGGAPEPDPVVETAAEELAQPWGMDVLPGGERLVVTQLPGVLSLVDTADGEVTDVDGVPEVDAWGQGGLLDVALAPDFAESEWLYLTYSADDGSGSTVTHLARGRLDVGQERLEDVEVLFRAEPLGSEAMHYGSRIVFGADERLYMTIGDRAHKNFDDHPAQDLSNTLGTTLRLEPDGSVPEDNPFVDDPDAADEIYSYGHRNAQGMAVHPETGELWQSEHGEEDGDEINILQAGGNHGWPVATTACEYGTDTPIGVHPSEHPGTVAPVHYWECGTGGFAPGGMAFYEGEEFPAWQGDLLLAGLTREHLARFTVDGTEVEAAEPLLEGEGRIRDVTVNPADGAVYVAVDADDAPLLRIADGS